MHDEKMAGYVKKNIDEYIMFDEKKSLNDQRRQADERNKNETSEMF